ncbi:MAG: ribonuclease HII [Candidatus Aureabacteria bacterium]|nr:ribonuclease HII [Candidatus Auribacterota bacterium]
MEETRIFEEGKSWIAGIDEAGRGPLAGPVVACAVAAKNRVDIPGVYDSKKLNRLQRKKLYQQIRKHPRLLIGIGQATVEEIEKLNILHASLLAFSRAVEDLKIKPDFCLLDGNQICPMIPVPQRALVKGDQRSFLIAAASIIAKETRDRIMEEQDKKWPLYGFSLHKGYGTALHLKAIRQFGPCRLHRTSFEPIKSLLSGDEERLTQTLFSFCGKS